MMIIFDFIYTYIQKLQDKNNSWYIYKSDKVSSSYMISSYNNSYN